jgi:hypothetical protein
MSTFADRYLETMTKEQLTQYDRFLDENDWDIYYWATQEPTPTSREAAEGAGEGTEGATASAAGKDVAPDGKSTSLAVQARSGEWAQTIGTFKPAYRPVPVRWKNSEILAMLRRHVKEKSAGGVVQDENGESTGGGGMAFMPEVKNMDR